MKIGYLNGMIKRICLIKENMGFHLKQPPMYLKMKIIQKCTILSIV